MLVGLRRAVARHQFGGGAADRVPRLDPENAGHVAVHQDVAQLLVLDVDDRRHGVDDHLQQTPAFGDRVFGALLIGDVAHRSLVADDLAGVVAHGAGAVGEPEHRIVARANLIFELANHAVALHQPLVFGPRRGVDVDRIGDVADAVDQILRRGVAHHPRQRRVGIEQRAAGRRDVDSVDRGFEQLAIAFLGEALFGERAHRRLARRVGVDQGLPEHFGGPGDVADLVVDVGRRDRGVLFAAGHRADRGRNRGERTHGAADHEQRREYPDQDAGGAEHDALPLRFRQRPCELAREHVAPPVTDLAQQFGDALDQASLGAQHLLVDVGYLPLADRYADDRLGIGVDRGAEVRLRNRHRAHALRGLFGSRWIARQQRRGDPALGLEQCRRNMGIGRLGDGGVELLAQRRQRDDHFGAAVDQRGNPLDPGAVGRQALADAVDHVLLLGGKLQPGLLQDLAERRGGLPDLDRLGARIGHEIARRQPQFVHAAVDVLGEVADALQPLQFDKGRIDMADGDDAGGRGDHDHRQHQHETAECQLADRQRERSRRRRIRRQFRGHGIGAGSNRAAIYDVFGPWGTC